MESGTRAHESHCARQACFQRSIPSSECSSCYPCCCGCGCRDFETWTLSNIRDSNSRLFEANDAMIRQPNPLNVDADGGSGEDGDSNERRPVPVISTASVSSEHPPVYRADGSAQHHSRAVSPQHIRWKPSTTDALCSRKETIAPILPRQVLRPHPCPIG
eukprot:CAMPEP_0183339050 /NCGR_PEP_ID=MMETSP0164_2-20130417/6119_1 /TAXON_ID=221442 /ORGANISM="Coccolithus pelagicus ssp braarudi, Strain PLY182g" /LENGTH=159 /DNA_ID=CAMNT_0025508995 /DNA_START=145 /DNA_END=624 /DNA_ORIENTATION=+